MKIHLASFFEEHNWGSGRLISIARGQKPRVVLVNLIYEGFCPSEKISRKYYADKQDGIETAGEDFQTAYIQEIEEFFRQASFDATKANKSLIELLDLKEGDTFLSWERAGRSNYRNVLANHLKKIGCDVYLEGIQI
jgi:hypothetical protein